MNKLYEKSELYFALTWIGIYCVVNSLANQISDKIGIDSSVTAVCNLILTVILFVWIRKRGSLGYYGLCGSSVPASRFLWYIPLVLFLSHNLWLGVGINTPLADTVCYIASMLCVGFLEEIIFRGFLFRALVRDNVKTAIIISSVTFGIGHILNLFNGSGMELFSNLCQVVGAIACGFLFVLIFCRGGSLIPCIVAHSVNNAISIFANDAAWTTEKQLLVFGINTVIVIIYTLVLSKTLSQTCPK